MSNRAELPSPGINATEAGKNFMILKESGPFSVRRPHSLSAWMKSLSIAESAEYTSLKMQIFQIMGISHWGELPGVINDPVKREQAKVAANQRISELYGFEGTPDQQDKNVRDLASLANGTILLIEQQIFGRQYAQRFEASNEVIMASHPVDLIGIMMNPKFSARVRFEAKRKWTMMMLGAAVRHTEREMRTNEKFTTFWDFIIEGKSPKGKGVRQINDNTKIGHATTIALLSTHDVEGDFACTNVEELSPERQEDVAFADLPEGQKYTVLQGRTFKVGDNEVPIYLTLRAKQASARVLKLIRKGHTNPAAAVEDEMGLMGVLRNKNEINLFLKHLQNMAIAAGTMMTIEEVESSLDGERFSARNKGSSEKLKIFKFFARINGMRVEIILHTYDSYINSIYQDEVSHDEFQANRFFTTGAAELLYPESIYGVPHEGLRKAIVRDIRRHNRGH